MKNPPSTKHLRLDNLVILGSVLFIVRPLIAMFTFPRGTRVDPGVRGYSFFRKFFSVLIQSLGAKREAAIQVGIVREGA